MIIFIELIDLVTILTGLWGSLIFLMLFTHDSQ